MRSSTRRTVLFSLFSVLSVAVLASLAGLRRVLEAEAGMCCEVERLRSRCQNDGTVLKSIIEHAPVGLVFALPDGAIQYQNEVLRRLVVGAGGSLLDDFGGVPSVEGLHWADGRRITPEEWGQVLREARERPVERLFQVRTSHGSSQWVSTTLAPVLAESDGRPLGIVVAARDVSAEHEIEQLREELVAMITHDLRNPIASIEFSLENALRRRTEREELVLVPVTVLERMTRSARMLGQMVRELLDASRVELGKLSLDRDAVDLPSFLTQLVGDVSPSLRDHPVQTHLPPQRVVASVDRLRLTQVVTNLLDNASKYSPPGSIIHLTLREEGGAVHLSVADEGTGIAPADLPVLFDRFFQARTARQRNGGLGLGLYITKGIVDAHGGKLSVDSQPGVGSTFHVWLPAVAALPVRAQQTPST